ncbi:c-type cytochrome [Candidatus Poribacteria bacterium]|nr:c-type cytochrome [Candidatus Poribacteria bacterium]MYB65163.1 c-type cytochrome [Candidatus Poribacteria bacterium]MYF54977.1 c-type cytochrome [Candidatus Poribacteria bacterium]
MKTCLTFFISTLILSVLIGCNVDQPTDVIDSNTPVESTGALSGGDTTIFSESSHAFSTPAPNLSADALEKHLDGDLEFEAVFVTAPAEVNPGLGPIYNNITCINCHVRDGRGKPPAVDEKFVSMLFRLSLPNTENADTGQSPIPVPGYGTQLNNRAIYGTPSEGTVKIEYSEQTLTTADGTRIHLRYPDYTITDTYKPIPENVEVSPRVAPVVFGLGLLEAIPEETILSYADEADVNGDGISGKPNYVWDVVDKKYKLGRFGWKANQPNLLQQVASAYHDDMGLTTSLFPLENSHGQIQLKENLTSPEVSDEILDVVTFYVQTLAVPARRNVNDPQVMHGEQLFAQAQCANCHIPTLRTGVLPGVPSVSNQTIHAFTDMLLHDMGPDLADNRPDFRASGSEWRTPPLWGIGLVQTVNGHTNFLHDGRARDLMEAILWHGGEAEKSRRMTMQMTNVEREALIAFLESL